MTRNKVAEIWNIYFFSGFFIKLLIKIIRKFGYEIIDQNNLQIPLKSSFANENLSENGVKSITVPLGETKITRKVNSLTIIIRS